MKEGNHKKSLTDLLLKLAKLCPTLSNPMGYGTSSSLVLHHHLELAQTIFHWVSDAIQPSHPLWPASPLTFNLSQQQGCFQCVSSLYQVTNVLEFQLQHQCFQWLELISWCRMTGIILQAMGLSGLFSSTTTQKNLFFHAQPSLQSNSHIYTWPWKNHSVDYISPF